MAILSANAVIDAIEEFYEGLLDRDPSPQESAFYLASYRINPSLEPIRAAIARSSEAREQVGELFRDVLDRPGDAGGLAFFQTALMDGASLDEVRFELARSAEARGAVNELYRDVLGRDGDASGLAFFQSLLADDAELDAVRASLAFSNEAKQQINAAYRSVLGRDAGPDGVAFFQAALADEGFEIDDVAELLAASDELRGGLAAAYAQATGEELERDELEEYTERLASGDVSLAALLTEIGALRLAGNDGASEPASPELSDDDDDAVPIPPSAPAMTFLVPASGSPLLMASPNADLFVFAAQPTGSAVIDGFDPAMDVLRFAPSTFTDRAAFDANLADTLDGVQLSFPLGGSLLLVGLDADDLTATAVALS